jgi:hypothetical protein
MMAHLKPVLYGMLGAYLLLVLNKHTNNAIPVI